MDYIKKMLAANEEVIFRTHRHWFVLFGSIFKEILILIILAVAAVLLTAMAQPWIWVVFAALAVLVLISILVDVMRWSNQEFLVTNRRVIHASGILNKSILDSSLNKINDVILTQSWLGRMFNFGTIKILTATDEVINLLDRIQRPIELKRAMMDAKGAMEPGAIQAAPAASATQLLEELAALKARNVISEEEYQEKRKEILRRM